MEPSSSSEHIRRNRPAWDGWAEEYVEPGRRSWAAEDPSWGIWGVPESEVRALPEELEGKATLEMGCGTGYVSSWFGWPGRPSGGHRPVDRAAGHGHPVPAGLLPPVPLVQDDAEVLPFPDRRFDVVISEYGASI
jgi:SAM-dependent methyltransferase